MLAVGFDVEATALKDPGVAGRVLAGLGGAVPARRRNRREAIAAPSEVTTATLSHPSLEAVRRNEGLIEFATLGSGNHFIELQSDEEALTDDEQVSVGRVVELLVEHGPSLPFPYSSGIATSRHRHMRELRIQHKGRPYRVLYAFDPRRAAILLLGGDKTGNDRWYEEHVPVADKLYDDNLLQLEREGLI